MFTEEQINEFKGGFNFIDVNKDGIIDEDDLRKAYDQIGKLISDKELAEMTAEAQGQPISFTMFLTMFAERMQAGSGGENADDDKLVIWAFKAFDPEKTGGIDPVNFEDYLANWGDVFSDKECKEIFPQLPRMEEEPHPDWISIADIVKMLTGAEEEEEVTASEG